MSYSCVHCGFNFADEEVRDDHQSVCLAYDPPEGFDFDAYRQYLTEENKNLDERIKCQRCDGYGTVGNPAFDGMSTTEMYDDMGYEETHEFLSEYTRRGGMYDVMCPCCKGEKVITRRREREFRQELAYQREVMAEQRMMGIY